MLQAEEKWSDGIQYTIENKVSSVTSDLLSQDLVAYDRETEPKPAIKPPKQSALYCRHRAFYEGRASLNPNSFSSDEAAVNFTAAVLADSGFIPPDTMGVVGPTQFIATLNGRFRSFDKVTGLADGVLNLTSDAFFAPILEGSSTSDPRVRYDRFSGRWFITMISVESSNNRLLLAFSDSGIITTNTVWTYVSIDPQTVSPARAGDAFYDFDTLGIDRHALYVGFNVFASSTGNLLTSDALVINKKSLLRGNHTVVTAFRNLLDISAGTGLFTPQGVDNFDRDSKFGYFIGISQATNLVLRKIKNPGGIPQISGNILVNIPLINGPFNVPQEGSAATLDANDARLSSSHIRNGVLYTSHNIAVNNQGVSSAPNSRDGSRWYQICLKDSDNPFLIQSGTLFASSATNDPNELYYWMPAPMTNGLKTMVLGCSVCGANSFANAAYALRYSNDPLGLLRAPVVYTNSTTSYAVQGDRVNRWGDYSHCSVDPTDDMTLWAIEEFCNDTNSWGVQVISIPAQPPATVTCVTPSLICCDDGPVLLRIRGKRVDGSAFFEPGKGFPKHLTVSIDDVKVLCVRRVKPTLIEVVVSASNALPGRKNIVITNPDGQQTTAKGFLFVQ